MQFARVWFALPWGLREAYDGPGLSPLVKVVSVMGQTLDKRGHHAKCPLVRICPHRNDGGRKVRSLQTARKEHDLVS